MNPKVLIVILNYGTYDLTINMVKQIIEVLEYDNYKIMVIDNCSPNESAKILAQYSKTLNYIFLANGNNRGYAAGNNIGIRYGIANEFEYTWILNNDVVFHEKNILMRLVSDAEMQDEIACVGPKIYSSKGTPCAPYCRRQSLWNMTLGIFEDKKYRVSKIDYIGEVYRIYGCCMLLKNKAMADVDCMDERTFLYGEEEILAERLIRKGYKTYYDSRVSITHMESTTIRRTIKNVNKMQRDEAEKSREIYLKEYRGFSKFARVLCHLTRRIIARFR